MKKRTKKRKTKTEREKLVQKLDEITKQVIRARDQGVCQMCGRSVTGSSAHCSHVIPRSRGNHLRWDLRNCKLLCFHCHINVWHKDPLAAWDWFKNKFPDRAMYLESQSHVTHKFSIQELEDLLEHHKKELQKYT